MWNTRRVVGLAVALLVLAGGVLLLRSSGSVPAVVAPVHPHPPATSPHGAQIDHAMGAVLALYHAPEGSTPCESAYNAFKASLDYSSHESVKAAVLRLSPREEFLQRCNELPPATQQCMVPLYNTQHKDPCSLVKPSDATMRAMVELQPRREGPPPGVVEPSPSVEPAPSASAP